MVQLLVERSMAALDAIAIVNVKASLPDKKVSYTNYRIHLENSLNGRSWIVHRRYRDFMHFRQLWMHEFDKYVLSMSKDGFHVRHIKAAKEMIDDLYFPKKKIKVFQSSRVVQHRSYAFVVYLQNIHQFLIMQPRPTSPFGNRYLQQMQSIFKGFLGSKQVRNVNLHLEVYKPEPLAISQHLIHPKERIFTTQCGQLVTIPEVIQLQQYHQRQIDPRKEQIGLCLMSPKHEVDNQHDNDDPVQQNQIALPNNYR